MPRTILGAEHSSLSKIDKTPALKRLFFQQEASKHTRRFLTVISAPKEMNREVAGAGFWKGYFEVVTGEDVSVF